MLSFVEVKGYIFFFCLQKISISLDAIQKCALPYQSVRCSGHNGPSLLRLRIPYSRKTPIDLNLH